MVDKTSLNFEDTMVSKSSSAASILVESKNVNSTVEISVTDGFEISSDNLNFGNSLELKSAKLLHKF